MRRLGLTARIVSVVVLVSGFILAVILTNSYIFSRDLITRQAEEQSRSHSREVALQLAALIKPIEQAARDIALALEDVELTEDKIDLLSRRVVANNRDIFAMAIAFEPYRFHPDLHYFAPYSYRYSDNSIRTTRLGSDDYRYFYMDWYQLPKELGQPVWTEPYFDSESTNTLMTTYAVPFYRFVDGRKRFFGVVTADISLAWLQKSISAINLYESGYAAVLSRNGTFIYHPVERLMFNETIFSIAEETKDQELWDIGRAMIEGKSGFFERSSLHGNKQSFFYYMPLPLDGWSMAILVPTREVLNGVIGLTRNTLLIGLAGFLLLTLATILTIKRIIRPIYDLSETAREIAGGNLNSVLPRIRTNDEVGRLCESFRHMQTSLAQYIADLQITTAQKERIDSELRIARDIQMGILPKLFPAFPDQEQFDIFASLKSAKEIGGDLYDFFFIDEDRFCFLIGDVSGKGVPAALFMAVTKTMIKVVAERERQPHLILEKVNNDLAQDNDSCMFVTLFLAVINIHTGELSYSSAGHNPPVLLTADETIFIESANEPMAGAMPGMGYTTMRMTLAPGDTLFLYTDGVTEAMNPAQQLYSDQRLLDLLSGTNQDTATKIISRVSDSVDFFADGAEQSDDITMLALTYNGDQAQS